MDTGGARGNVHLMGNDGVAFLLKLLSAWKQTPDDSSTCAGAKKQWKQEVWNEKIWGGRQTKISSQPALDTAQSCCCPEYLYTVLLFIKRIPSIACPHEIFAF